MSPTKPKKKKRDRSADSEADLQIEVGSVPALPAGASGDAGANQLAVVVDGNYILNWPKDDIVMLVSQMNAALPANDRMKYSTRIKRMDWDKVAFGNYSADDCNAKWLEIQSRQRLFRTMQELLIDATAWIRVPWTTFGKLTRRHPDYPKRPLTPFFRFYQKKLPEYVEQHPGEQVSSLAQMITAEFGQLPEKKIRHYRKAYDREMLQYKQDVESFHQTHPEAMTESMAQRARRKIGPRRPLTPMMLFVTSKMEGQQYETEELRKAASDNFKSKWKKLKPKKKYKWIKKTMEDKARYMTELAEYQIDHPECKAQLKRLLTKEEQRIKDQFDGRPVKPPMSGYLMFCRKMMEDPTFKACDLAKRNQFLGDQWQHMSDAERKEFNDQVQKELIEYKDKYDEYLDGLPEHERKEVEKADRGDYRYTNSAKDRRFKLLEKWSTEPLVTTKAYTVFQTKQMKDPANKNLSADELMKKTYGLWQGMDLWDKDEYFRAARKDEPEEPPLSLEDTQIIENLKRIQPKKPPRSGYSIYSRTAMSKWNSISNNKKRLEKVAEEWKSMSQAKRDKFKKQYKEAMAQYKVEVEAFKEKLDTHSLHLFTTFVENKTRKKLNSTLKKARKDNISAGHKWPVKKRNLKRNALHESAGETTGDEEIAPSSPAKTRPKKQLTITADADSSGDEDEDEEEEEEDDDDDEEEGASNEEFVDAVEDSNQVDDDSDEDDDDDDDSD